MAVLPIFTYPAPILAKPAKKVENVDEGVRNLISDMAETLAEQKGLGLAAVQVGEDRRLIIYQLPENHGGDGVVRALINPVIEMAEGKIVSEGEGCLSVPEFRADVQRAERVCVTGLDGGGEPVRIEADGLLSIILQHEIDHLEGVLFIDRISRLKREMYRRRVKKQMKRYEQ